MHIWLLLIVGSWELGVGSIGLAGWGYIISFMRGHSFGKRLGVLHRCWKDGGHDSVPDESYQRPRRFYSFVILIHVHTFASSSRVLLFLREGDGVSDVQFSIRRGWNIRINIRLLRRHRNPPSLPVPLLSTSHPPTFLEQLMTNQAIPSFTTSNSSKQYLDRGSSPPGLHHSHSSASLQ